MAKPEALSDWIIAAGLPIVGPMPATSDHLRGARLLREAIYRCGLAAIAGKALDDADIAILNLAAAGAPLRPQYVCDSLIYVGESPIEAALSTVAEDALRLLASPSRRRIRLCPGCAMMFVDTSRPGKRLWCSSAAGCGNRAKVRNLRARRSGAEKQGGLP